MTNSIELKCTGLVHAAALSVEPGRAYYALAKKVPEACERFLRSAALLPKGAFLGWQIGVDVHENFSGCVFSSPGAQVTADDFNWIFRHCVMASQASPVLTDGLFNNNRKVYMLVPMQVLEYEVDVPERQAKSFIFEDYDDVPPGDCIDDMFDVLTKAGAIIRVTAGPAAEKNSGHGMVFVSLPGEMTLRMRSMLAFVFPHMEACEINGLPNYDDKTLCLPDECFLNGMTKLFHVFICQAKNDSPSYESDSEEISEDFDLDIDGIEYKFTEAKEETDTYTSIDDLDLSIRSYNCLTRAGITSVEKLRTLSDDDLLNIRNFGMKSRDEVRQKLSEFKNYVKLVPQQVIDYMAQLDELVGLEDVKAQVKKIVAYAKMKKDMAARGDDSLTIALNMEFVGNPGTAKTTVARIIAGIFNQIGLLPSNELIEVGRADLVAKYEGQTADRVKHVFEWAKGKVLFIDEAYSLVENWEGEFGDEAINTIVQEMENNREHTVVIFAGYPNKMEEFLTRNPGLRSRVPFCIPFKDYSAQEMVQIARSEAKKKGFSISSEARESIMTACQAAANNPNMGNGRFCRNLVESAILNYALRIYGDTDEAVNSDFCLSAKDFAFPDTLQQPQKQVPIGFRA